MSCAEILVRIAYDLDQLNVPSVCRRRVTIALTVELFQLLCPGEHLLIRNDAMVRLFGCDVKVLPCSGRWWIVGLEGSAEEDKT